MPQLSPSPDLTPGRVRDRKKRVLRIEAPAHSVSVIAFDPGGTTGWSLMSVHAEAIYDNGLSIFDNINFWQHGQIDCGSKTGNRGTGEIEDVSTHGEAAGVNEAISLMRAWPGAAIVIEDFIVRQMNQSRDFLSPVRVTAAMSQYLYNQHRPFYTQQPSMAKSSATDERLKNWGLYERNGGMNHARDADRHAITFLRRVKSVASSGKKQKKSPLYLPEVFPHVYGERGPYCEPVQALANGQPIPPSWQSQ